MINLQYNHTKWLLLLQLSHFSQVRLKGRYEGKI